MQITIVGTGNMARGIATRALAGGHTVTITAKDPRKAVELVDELGKRDHSGGRIGAGDESAVRAADMNPVDIGVLKHARELGGFQLLHMALQIREGGHNWASAIKVVAP